MRSASGTNDPMIADMRPKLSDGRSGIPLSDPYRPGPGQCRSAQHRLSVKIHCRRTINDRGGR
jgi:hypothetical protein